MLTGQRRRRDSKPPIQYSMYENIWMVRKEFRTRDVCLWNRANLELELVSPSSDSSHIVIVSTVSLMEKQIDLGFYCTANER